MNLNIIKNCRKNLLQKTGDKMKQIEGDLIELAKQRRFDVIAHGCNCFCVMGAGIAKSIKENFPEAYREDQKTKKGDQKKLGTCNYVTTNTGLIVVNAYTQYDYSGKGPQVDYDAVATCMRWIKKEFLGKRIGLPRIGAGLAGGNWERIEKIINKELGREDVTIVIKTC